jgi:hypothetical protein
MITQAVKIAALTTELTVTSSKIIKTMRESISTGIVVSRSVLKQGEEEIINMQVTNRSKR